MTKQHKATGIESALCKSWDGWEGEIEWIYFYDTELLPEIKAKCIAAGMDPDANVDIEITLVKLEGRVLTFDEAGVENFELPFTLTVTPVFS